MRRFAKMFRYDVVWSGEPPQPSRPYRGSAQMEQAVEEHLKERLEMGDLVPDRIISIPSSPP